MLKFLAMIGPALALVVEASARSAGRCAGLHELGPTRSTGHRIGARLGGHIAQHGGPMFRAGHDLQALRDRRGEAFQWNDIDNVASHEFQHCKCWVRVAIQSTALRTQHC